MSSEFHLDLGVARMGLESKTVVDWQQQLFLGVLQDAPQKADVLCASEDPYAEPPGTQACGGQLGGRSGGEEEDAG